MILDRQTLEKLFYQYAPRLENYAGRFVLDSRMAQDMVQDVFVKFWVKYQGKSSLNWGPLLFTITRNVCLDHLKHISFERTVIADDINITADEEFLFFKDFCDVSETDCRTILDELNRDLVMVADSLPQRCREVFMMSRVDGLKNREIASRLQISEKAVEKHITIALKAFRKMLGKH